MKTAFVMAMLLSVGGLCPGWLHAEGECKADIQKFCGNVEPGQGRIIGCLKTHFAELTPDCQTSLKAAQKEIRTKVKAIQEACSEDAKKFCGDVQPGEGRIKDCMTQHASELSDACHAVVTPTKTPNPS